MGHLVSAPVCDAAAAVALFGLATPTLAAVGRTAGSAAVSQSGSAQYQIALALPAGRRGLTPPLGLVYDSNGSRGVAGLGWSIAGASIISRCEKTVAQDGAAQGVRNQTTDGYCLDGNRLRLVGGTYGAAGSTYRTELNNFSRITAVGSAGKARPRSGSRRAMAWFTTTASRPTRASSR